MNGGSSSIFIIIPAFNEAPVLATTILPLAKSGYTVVVVDDGSTDSTWDTLAGLPVVRLRHLVNLGQGAALETGMEYARRHGAQAVVHFDADGQHDPMQIPALLAPLSTGNVDVVLGSRFLRHEDAVHVPLLKRVLLRVGILISGVASGVWLTDTHNGFRALSRSAFVAIRLREHGFAHATEILSEIRRLNLRYKELPTTIVYSDYSKAKGQSPWNALTILLDLVLRRVFR